MPVAETREVVHLYGDAYTRGKQHGTLLRSKVRAFYTKLLAVALLPNLNREQPSIAGFLLHYQTEPYQDGRFSYQVLLEMAQSIEPELSAEVRDELRGIADGSGLSYEEVLILNTFADTVLAVRAIAATLKLSHGPRLMSVQFLGKKTAAGEQQKPLPYVALPHALTTTVPLDGGLRLRIDDQEGVAVETLRVLVGDVLFVHDSPGVTIEQAEGKAIDVTIVPPAGLPAATQVGVVVNVADNVLAEIPPPAHLRFARDEGFSFTTAGDPRAAKDVPNIAPDDGSTRPPPVIVGLRGGSVAGGGPLLGQHFALLDAGAAHETTVILVHHPDGGPAYASVGWAGIAWGFSGMNEAGLGYACNFSDTLDNAIVKDLLPLVSDLPSATLTATGVPVGFAMREALAAESSVGGAITRLGAMQHVMGWVCGLVDKGGGLAGVELDADARLLPSPEIAGTHVIPGYGEGEDGGPAGANGDELALSVHFVEHVVDVNPGITNIASALLAQSGLNVRIAPQSVVSTYWLKSLRTAHRLSEAVAAGRGTFDVGKVEALLGEEAFVDRSDSMNAVVLEPAKGRLHHAMGEAPATDAPWQTFSFGEAP